MKNLPLSLYILCIQCPDKKDKKLFFLRNFAQMPRPLSVDTKNSFAYNEYQQISRFSGEGKKAEGEYTYE